MPQQPRLQQQRHRDGPRPYVDPPEPLPPCDGSGKQCIYRQQHKRDPISPRPRCDGRQRRIVNLRVAELIPRHLDQMRAQQVDRGPQTRRQKQRRAHIAGCVTRKGNQPSEEPVVQPHNQAVQQQDARRYRRRQSAVEKHRLVDPVAVDRVPHHAEDPAGEKAAPQRPRSLITRQQRHQQRHRAKPRKDRPPHRQRPGDGKAQVQQHGREHRQSQAALGCLYAHEAFFLRL